MNVAHLPYALPHHAGIKALGVVILATLCSCSTVDKVNALLDEATNTARKAGQLADNMPGVIQMAAANATESVTQSAAKLGRIPAMAPTYTGGTDVGRSSGGKSGAFMEDVDGDGTEEAVTAFIDEDDAVFLSFEVEWEEGRDCYTTWQEGEDEVWMVITECGDVAEDELVDVCSWSLDSDALFCVGLLCTGDDCEVELCYDEEDEVDCGALDDVSEDDLSEEDDEPEDDGGSDDVDSAGGDCSADASVIEAAYAACDFGDPALDCETENDEIATCAEGIRDADDGCAYLDSEEGLSACPWE